MRIFSNSENKNNRIYWWNIKKILFQNLLILNKKFSNYSSSKLIGFGPVGSLK